MARHQWGDFVWKPQWEATNAQEKSLLMHNMPFDMYFVDSSCGPHVQKCKPYDFRWFGNIGENELQKKADQLIGEYERSASLYAHNVFLAIVGGDFRYNMGQEFDQQYNYKKLIDYVNANGERYNNAKMQFGTPKDYFKIIRERTEKFPTLAGDLFPYGDIFTDGHPSYWTGYFTTRPFIKIMARDLEHQLRTTEILFTLAFNQANHEKAVDSINDLKGNYQRLITARRNLGLVQHHDAITGTSRALVMKNYRDRMFESIRNLTQIQQRGLEILMQKFITENTKKNFITSTFNYASAELIPTRTIAEFTSSKSSFEYVLFNSLGHERIEIASVRVTKPNVRVTDADGNEVAYQVNYLCKRSVENGAIVKMDNEMEVIFVARLPALSIATFIVTYIENGFNENIATFEVMDDVSKGGDIFIQNAQMRLEIDASTGLLKSVTSADNLQVIPLEIKFGGYKTLLKRSGAYLFETDGPERAIFENDAASHIVIVKGPIASYITVVYGTLLFHTVRLLKTQTHLDNAMFIVNRLSIEERHSNVEMFMRIKTSIDNGQEFFTDLNGFQWMRRQRTSKLKVEGNYYPITNSIFIQDKNLRATLVTNHAQGATSANSGELEVMLDKRTPQDDQRGMEEGVKDIVPTIQQYWLSIEFLSGVKPNPELYNVPSLHVHHLTSILNYPANIYLLHHDTYPDLQIDTKFSLLKKPLPCDLNLFNLRTVNDVNQATLPSRSALLIVHKLNYDCNIGVHNNAFYSELCLNNEDNFDNIDLFEGIQIENIQRTSLTALKSHGSISSFKAESIEAMELKTFNVTFIE